jgi:predicted dehydrogenase
MRAVAVIGTGFIGPVHVEALRRLNIPVKGILGSSPDKSQAAAKALGLALGYPSLEALLADDEVSAVHITSPNRLHLAQAKAALEAGKHVICEKPLAMTTQETAQLLELARSRPQQLAAVNYNVRFYPLVLQARALIRQGALGEIYSVTGCYVQDWLHQPTDWNWRVSAEAGGALRAIGDIGTHWMDLMYFVTGQRVKRLLADLTTFISERHKPIGSVQTFAGAAPQQTVPVAVDTEDFGAVLFHYDGGARGVMHVSQVAAGRKNRLSFEIAGAKGSLAWDAETPNQLWLGRRDRANELLIKDPALLDSAVTPYANYPGGHTEGFPDTFKQLYRAIYDYLKAGDFSAPKPFPTFEDGHYEVMLCEKILESHRQRAWVTV